MPGSRQVTSKDLYCDSQFTGRLIAISAYTSEQAAKSSEAQLSPFLCQILPKLLDCGPSIYIDEERGFDGTDTQGTEASPFQSLAQAYLKHGSDNEYRVKKKGDEEFKPAAKAALKKAINYADAQRKKREAAAKRAEKEEQETTAAEAALAATQNIHIAEDPALPKATLIDIEETDPQVIGRLRKTQDEPPQKGAARRVRV
jgi:hypothetical protein